MLEEAAAYRRGDVAGGGFSGIFGRGDFSSLAAIVVGEGPLLTFYSYSVLSFYISRLAGFDLS